MKKIEVILRIKKINIQLLELGFTIEMIDDFWNECINLNQTKIDF